MLASVLHPIPIPIPVVCRLRSRDGALELFLLLLLFCFGCLMLCSVFVFVCHDGFFSLRFVIGKVVVDEADLVCVELFAGGATETHRDF